MIALGLLMLLAGCADWDWRGTVARSMESACRSAANCTVEAKP